ncbi:hypothetical protein [Streptomyces sp. NPDC047706]|uniref:SCO2400 family protein n=1 Tax=Streptomyces sp. NPDC047706 TaxID=3365486 RepID=UPI00371D9C05
MDYWQMDYCSSCRRHLNGALACPGCGAYAPDIAPAPRAQAEPEPVCVPPVPQDGPEAVAVPAREGRAARRRQRIRWRRSQRRALVATAVALVGGGLTLTSLDRGARTDRAQTAAAPEELTLETAPRTPAQGTPPTQALPQERRTAPRPAATPSPAADATASRSHRLPTAPAPHSARPETPVAVPSAPRPPRHRSDSPVPPVEPAPAAPQPATPPADPGTPPAAPATPPPAPPQSAPPQSAPPQLCLLVICLG